ncbi:hypothetical protein HSBAA_PA_1460 (plasmid) [Vreelandella sulfidaeris]|uniref:Uncharacterized protein n=1 Tax=Vreelandella sulfidaeris TaxID=115553 RepID=A0A455UJI1_9GAMM|nr:hypothetical protein HSBAA_PA_1460 [Halomonas sulfidaeris]
MVLVPGHRCIHDAIDRGVAVIAGQPWLFPSLGPSIFLHVHKPNLESARLYNTVMGHLIGVSQAQSVFY